MEPTTLPGSKSSPMKQHQQGFNNPDKSFVHIEVDAEVRRKQLVLEMDGDFLRYPTENVVDLLKPVKHKGKLKKAPVLNLDDMPEGSGLENQMSAPLEAALEESDCCPSLEFVNTSGVVDSIAHLRPDGIMLPRGVWASGLSEQRNYLCHTEIIWELKATASLDAFCDVGKKKTSKPVNVEANTKPGRESRGAIVSHSFCCLTTDWLAEFLWRYDHASRTDRGFDDTVSVPTNSEIEAFTGAVQDYIDQFLDGENSDRAKHRATLAKTLDTKYPPYKVRVTDGTKKKALFYIIRRPFSSVLSPCGRATRGYMAWGLKERRLLFLKDTWRSEVPGVLTETQVYVILGKLGVPNLATVLISGDVYNLSDKLLQETLTSKIAVLLGHLTWIREHVHHRMLQELALPLCMVKNSKQLVQAIRNVLETIKAAYAGGRALGRDIQPILHRDISSGNVMLNASLEGILNDWDHAIELPVSPDCHPYRTGTWQFMSVEMLSDPLKAHELADDVESCFWLLLFIASRYFRGGLDSSDILFEEFRMVKGDADRQYPAGGLRKASYLRISEFNQLAFDSAALTKVLQEFGRLLTQLQGARLLMSDRSPPPYVKKFYLDVIQMIEGVDAIIKIFDDAIASSSWRPFDRVADQQRRVNSEVNFKQIKQGAINSRTAVTAGDKRAREDNEDEDDDSNSLDRDTRKKSRKGKDVTCASVLDEPVSRSRRVSHKTTAASLPSGSVNEPQTSIRRSRSLRTLAKTSDPVAPQASAGGSRRKRTSKSQNASRSTLPDQEAGLNGSMGRRASQENLRSAIQTRSRTKSESAGTKGR